MEPNPSFKTTEVGSFPKDWHLVPLGDVITEFRGGAPFRPSDFTCTGVKVLPKGGVGRTGWLQVEEVDLQYCSVEYATAHQRNMVDETFAIAVLRDLVPSGPSIGLMVQIRNREKFVLAQGVYGFKVNTSAVPGYLVQLSNTRWYRKLANSIMVGSTQVHITNTAFKQVRVPLPSPVEQNAIAVALSDADAFIESLEQLIDKERQIKHGAMQELLTGKRRLPGFTGAWEVKALKKLTQIPVTDGPHLTPRFVSDGIPFLSVNNLVDNRVDFTELRYISREDHVLFSKKCKPQMNDILFGKAASVGKVAIVDFDLEFNVWSPIAVIRINNENTPRFIYYSAQSEGVARQIALLTNSSSQGNIGMSDIGRLAFRLPRKEEQTAIATILSDMDTEIAALETKLAKARQLKQGMMQELLTGRIRLV